jgi:hypothetical protein
MIIDHISNMKMGWFIGNFDPSVYKTEHFEVGYKEHYAKEKYGHHYHTKIKEINFLIEGEMIIQNKKLNSGDIFILEPFEIADPEFITNCKIICIKIPGIVGDKINI